MGEAGPDSVVRPATSRLRDFDGRWLTAGIVALYFATVWICGARTDSVRVWDQVGVEVHSLRFADLRFLTAAVETHRAGGDPRVFNRCDPRLRRFNYPRIWLGLSKFNIGAEQTVPGGFLLATIFYIAVFFVAGRIAVAEGVVYALLLCSPAAILAVERGNIDLVIFPLIVLAALQFEAKRGVYWSYLPVTLASILKLYPVCAFALALRERRRYAFGIIALCFAAVAVYFYCIRGDIALMNAATPQIKEISYGRRVLFQELASRKLRVYVQLWSELGVISAVGLGAIGQRFIRMPSLSTRGGPLLTTGAAIYAGTFAMLNSFNYRMIFLLLLIPQLLEWLKHRRSRAPAAFALFAIFYAMLFASAKYRFFFILKEAANWTVFVFCIWILFSLAAEAALRLSRPCTSGGHAVAS